MPSTKLKQTLTSLQGKGSEGTKKIYLRHGAREPLYGVKFGDLTKIRKTLGVDHTLAVELWETGNNDAMTLALMIADPDKMKSGDIDRWMQPLKYDLLIGMLCEVVAKTKHARSKWKKWSRMKAETKLVAAYSLLSHWLKSAEESLPDEIVINALDRIHSDIHQSPNLARHAMNNALIAIGVFSQKHRAQAIKVAKAIGKVDVDHGETNCKTPDAVGYIEKALKHNRKRSR